MKTSYLKVLVAVFLMCALNNANAQSYIIYPEPLSGDVNMEKVKVLMTDFLYKNSIYGANGKLMIESYAKKKIKSFQVFDDRIEMKNLKTNDEDILHFSDIIDRVIKVTGSKRIYHDGSSIDQYFLEFENLAYFLMTGEEQKMANYLYYIQCQLNKKRIAELNLFKPVAVQYCALKVKPPITEEQRKVIVQANALTEKKEYENAIKMYFKAIALNPMAYTGAYSNVALLLAQEHNFYSAIYYMKKYLMLEPDASDARSAQDKIYAWELEIPENYR